MAQLRRWNCTECWLRRHAALTDTASVLCPAGAQKLAATQGPEYAQSRQQRKRKAPASAESPDETAARQSRIRSVRVPFVSGAGPSVPDCHTLQDLADAALASATVLEVEAGQ